MISSRLFVGLVTSLAVTASFAVVPPEGDPLRQNEFRHPELQYRNVFRPVSELPAGTQRQLGSDLSRLGVDPANAYFDLRTGRWGTLILVTPMIPGPGVHNDLQWSSLGYQAAPQDEALKQAIRERFRSYLIEHATALRIDPQELGASFVTVISERLVYIHIGRQIDGVPVRDTFVKAALNSGNLVLWGQRNWAPTEVNVTPRLTSAEAEAVVQGHVEGFPVIGLSDEPLLELVPTSSQPEEAATFLGAGLEYRLAWVLRPQFESDLGSWEAVVDAHSGELLSFVDTNHYASRRAEGGIFPVSNDGQGDDGTLQFGFPMPFADITLDGIDVGFTTTGGNLPTGSDPGVAVTALSGPFVRMNDNCGTVNESVAAGDLDLEGVPLPGTDCQVPLGHSAGDTNASRSGFYELNRLKEQARGYLPDNNWLDQQLTANMNINQNCNAFWNGSTVNFYTSGGGCRNTGEIAAIFDHEWGHGMDNNDGVPSISRPGEGIADIFAQNRLNQSCIGRGFRFSNCSGYGDPCIDCTGVRDTDYAKRQSGQPHDVAFILSNCTGGGNTPCGRGTHCEGSTVSESIWDLVHRDLMGFDDSEFNLDLNTALELGTRLSYYGSSNVFNWYQCVTDGTGGCNADSGYLGYLTADDDNGDLTDGTPHMSAIFAAFDRHQIACPSPTVQNSGCAGAPASAPANLSADTFDEGMQLSWDPVADATEYQIFRTEGVHGCDFGKTLVGTTSGTTFTETGLRNGFEVLYSVVAVGANDACTSPMSGCLSVIPTAGPSGFIEGTVIDADTLEPIENAAVEAVGPVTVSDATDANGNYSILAPVGTYDVTADHANYDPETVSDVEVAEGGTEFVDFELTLTPVPIADISPDSFTFEAQQGNTDSDTLNIGNLGTLDLTWSITEDSMPAPAMLEEWSDNFDSYATGSQIHGQGGWKGWDNSPTAGALVSDAQANSTPNSVEVVGASDIVREFTDSDSGQWVFTARQFIPTDFTGATYFILLNTYQDGGPYNWSTQVQFAGSSNTVVNDGASGGTLPLIRDQWVEIRLEIDLDTDTQNFFYNDQLLYSGTWTNEVSGGGQTVIDAVDLFANGASAVYYDDLSLVDVTVPPGCADPNDVPWLSVNPESGTTPSDSTVPVDVMVDTTGLDIGEHTASLCVATNDPDAPEVQVPVTLTVFDTDAPVIDVAPESFSFTAPEGGSDADDLAISNVGGGTLTWDIETAEPAGSVIATWRAAQAQKAADTPVTDSLVSGAGGVFPETGNLLTLGNTQISQTTDTNIVPANSVACPTGPNHLMRRFYFDEHPDVGNPAEISSVDIAIQEGVESQTLTVNLYTLASDTPVDTIPVGSLTEIGTGSVTISPSDDGTIVNVPVSGAVSDTGAFDLVVEATVTNVFFIGATNTGETHPGFITAPACGVTTPTRIDSIPGFEDTHIIMVVNTGDGGGPGGCDTPTTIPWLSVSPDSGSTDAGETDLASVMVDAGDLEAGDYEALLCVNSNDSGNPQVTVPLSLTVTPPTGGPVADITPDAFTFEVTQGGGDSDVLNVGNIGEADLTWSIDEAEPGAPMTFVPEGAPYRYGLAEMPAFNAPVGASRASGIAHSRGEARADRVVLPAPQAQAVGSFTEGFDDITTLPGAGWAMINNSEPVGPSSWFQGNDSIFPAHEGEPDAYIAANYESTSGNGDISNWLLTPEVTIINGTEACFWTRTTPLFEEFLDRLEVRMSAAGASTDVGDTAESVGDFTTLLLTIEPDLELPNEYPEEWTQFCVTVRERSRQPVTGRFAFRYWVTDSGPEGTNGDYIGIDMVSVTQPDDIPDGGCDNPVDIPWLAADPTSGTTAPGASEPVTVTVDAADLEIGEHTALLCVSTNDPIAPLVEVSVSVTVTEPGGQGWVWQHPLPQGNELRDVVFLDSTTGIAIGYGGVILRTTDGGQTWSLVDLQNILTAHGPYYLLSVSKVDANTVWASGYYDTVGLDPFQYRGTILKSTDGGLTWSTNFTGGPGTLFSDIHFMDATHGIAVGYDQVNLTDVFRTTDGGETWTPAPYSGAGGMPWEVCFTDLNVGYMVDIGGGIRKTSDGGDSWTQKYSDPSGTWFKACFFADENNGTVVGSGGTILSTTDGGETWLSQSSPVTNDLLDVYFADGDNGWIVTDWLAINGVPPQPGHILHTSDGGSSWTVQHSLPGGATGFGGIYLVDANTGWAVATGGDILRTADGGATWTEVAGTGVTMGGFSKVSSVDESTSVAIGGGPVVKTTDGGKKWTLMPETGIDTNRDVTFVDAETGWVVGTTSPSPGTIVGKILKTTDGANTWTEQLSVGSLLAGVYFLDANTGWVCGSSGKIWRTTDGGATWIEEASGTTRWLNAVSFVDANTGWVVGESINGVDGEILKTTDGGKTWISQGVFNSPMHAISFIDSNTGWAVGGDTSGSFEGGIILKTTDGGTSWTEQQYDSSIRLRGVRFANADQGVAVGYGLIMSTEDGGDTWMREPIPVGIAVNDVSYDGAGSFTIVGSGASIIRIASVAPAAPSPMPTPTAARQALGLRRLAWAQQTAECAGRHADNIAEDAREVRLVGETERHGSLRERHVRAAQQVRGLADAQCAQVFADGLPVHAPEHRCQVDRMHAGLARERRGVMAPVRLVM